MKNFPDDTVTVFQCECDSIQHQMTWRYTPSVTVQPDIERWWPPELYLSVCLSLHLPWYKRLWYGIQYILGRDPKSIWNAFDTSLIDVNDVPAMVEMLRRFENESAEYHQRLALKEPS